MQLQVLSTAPVVGTSYWKQKGFDINGESLNNNDQSGISVDINSAGNIIVIGASKATIANGTANRGHVRIYKYRLFTQADYDNETFHHESQERNGTQNKPLIITPSTSVGPVVGNYYWTQLGDDIDNGDTLTDGFGLSVSINSWQSGSNR